MERRRPRVEEVRICPCCRLLVLLYEFSGTNGRVLRLHWDPDPFQRRWLLGLTTAAERASWPPWNWAFGREHECPPEGDSPLVDRERLRRAAGGEGGGHGQ